jgi:hypothetical protein
MVDPMARPLALAIATACLLCLTAAPAGAGSKRERSIYRSPLLWATINVCDTEANPDTIGIRGSIPGSGRRSERMFMRFQIQYFSRQERRWHNITQGADSGFIAVGHAGFRARQAGWSFRFSPAPDGTPHRLRGAVTFEWRRGGKVVRRARKRTSGGRESAAGADPAGFTAAVCEIR